MRYINLQLMIGDEQAAGVLKAAEAACDEILGETNATKRKQLIKTHRPKWVAFREHFERIYGAKCWYTECENPGTDDDIDHYRPKGRIFEDNTHSGYWWEALNWRNFRLSCHRANRPRENPETGQAHGKADHFPLADPADRWRKPADACHEKPLLLDPVRAGDPNILTFYPNGKVALAPKFEQNAEAKLRFEASRTFLHLDWPAIRQGRQMLYADIARRVDDGNQAAAGIAQGDPNARLWLDRVIGGLIELAQPKMPYSRAAQAYIRCHRARPWVETEVLPHILHVEPVAEEIAA